MHLIEVRTRTMLTRVSDQPPALDADEAGTDPPEQLRVRQDKRARLLAEGRQPYPVSVPRTHELREVRAQWGHLETGEETADLVGVAGRVVFIRNTGKLCFATLQEGLSPTDSGTRLQVMLSLARSAPGRWPPGRPMLILVTSSSSAAG